MKQSTFLTSYLRFLQIEYIGTFKVPIGTNNWVVETYRKVRNIQFFVTLSRYGQTRCWWEAKVRVEVERPAKT